MELFDTAITWMGDNFGIMLLIGAVLVFVVGAIRGLRNKSDGYYNSSQDGVWWDDD